VPPERVLLLAAQLELEQQVVVRVDDHEAGAYGESTSLRSIAETLRPTKGPAGPFFPCGCFAAGGEALGWRSAARRREARGAPELGRRSQRRRARGSAVRGPRDRAADRGDRPPPHRPLAPAPSRRRPARSRGRGTRRGARRGRPAGPGTVAAAPSARAPARLTHSFPSPVHRALAQLPAGTYRSPPTLDSRQHRPYRDSGP